jgi:hypothetical protein
LNGIKIEATKVKVTQITKEVGGSTKIGGASIKISEVISQFLLIN